MPLHISFGVLFTHGECFRFLLYVDPLKRKISTIACFQTFKLLTNRRRHRANPLSPPNLFSHLSRLSYSHYTYTPTHMCKCVRKLSCRKNVFRICVYCRVGIMCADRPLHIQCNTRKRLSEAEWRFQVHFRHLTGAVYSSK